MPWLLASRTSLHIPNPSLPTSLTPLSPPLSSSQVMSLGGLQSLLSLASLGEKNRAATSLAQEALQRLSAEDVEIARQVREYMERQRGTSGGGSGSSSSLMAQGGGAAAPEVLLLEQRVRRRGSFDLTSPSPSDAVLPARPSSSHHTREPTLSHAFPTLSSPVGSPTGRAAPGSSPQRSPSQAVLPNFFRPQ